MTAETLTTLLHPFDVGELDAPESGARVLFLGAEAGFHLPEGFDGALSLVQGFRPSFLALRSAGWPVTPLPEGDGYDMALVLAGRHRGENELRLAEAIERVEPGGLIVMAGGKTDGIDSLRKRLKRNEGLLDRPPKAGRALVEPPTGAMATYRAVKGPEGDDLVPVERQCDPSKVAVPLGGHLSKNHGVAFWLRAGDEARAFARDVGGWWHDWPLIEGRFHTAPGMFSHDRVDAGSRLVAAHLPDDLAGKVADFCAGWGYLAAEVARRDKVRAIDLYEADFASLEAAKRNLASEAARLPVDFHWLDLAAEPVKGPYDAIVMNPPFHHGRAADPGIGQAIIRAAARALRRGGRLFMVANRQLPYEETLKAAFSQWREVVREDGFKVLAATR